MSFDFDLRLAFDRVRDEIAQQPKTGRALVANPFEIELAEIDLDGWLAEREDELVRDVFVPGPIEICDAPKAGGLVRPAARLGLRDRVIYTAALGTCLEEIDHATRWSQGSIDFAVRLDPAGLQSREWLRNPFKGWDEFRARSVDYLDAHACVVTADIAGYFEHISHRLLISDLRALGCDLRAVSVLSRCLSEWAVTPDRGVPQGVMASDILAKLYLTTIDRCLKSEGYVVLRYVDDLRIFVDSEEEAREAVVRLTRLLRDRGLSLQSAKTQIRRTSEVGEDFEGVVPAIRRINRGYMDEAIIGGLMAADVSLPMSAIDDLANADPSAMDPEVLRRAYRELVVERGTPHPTMLRYLLNRLGGRGDDFAFAHCCALMRSNPEHTAALLKYFDRLPDREKVQRALVDLLADRRIAIYPYQRYLILDWLRRRATRFDARGLQVIRALAFRPESARFLQVVARQLLGRLGDRADVDQLLSIFRSTSDPLERAQLLCCLRRLEKGRRNSIAARACLEGELVARAAALVRAPS